MLFLEVSILLGIMPLYPGQLAQQALTTLYPGTFSLEVVVVTAPSLHTGKANCHGTNKCMYFINRASFYLHTTDYK